MPLPSSPLSPQAEEAKTSAIRSLWCAFFLGWASFTPTALATMWHLSEIHGREYGIIIGLSSVLSFLLMWALQWNFIRGIKKNKKNSILKMAAFILLFIVLGAGSDSSENLSPFMGGAHWLIYISGLGLFFCSLWQLYILWVLREKLVLYGTTHEKTQASPSASSQENKP